MKKILASILILMFFVISCSNSKKTENDADVLQDEDTTDFDGNEENEENEDEPDEDMTDVDEDNEDEPDEISDTDEENPCDPNPCEGKENTTGECIVDEWYDNMGGKHYFKCVCDKRYSYYWNGWKCTNECEGNPCQYEEHAIADSCYLADTPTAYGCDCEEGYHWAYFDCEQDSEEN